MTINLFPTDIYQYAERHTSPESETLAALNRETHVKVDRAVMLSGHLQGAFLQMFSCAMRPRCILELGTFTGYSAICLAKGLQPGGKLITIDIDEELHDMQRRYFELAGMGQQIVQLTGKALELIPQIDESLDLVFMDADKVNYSAYYDLVIGKVAQGGFVLADNVLYEGDVTLPPDKQGKNAAAMHAFNQKIAADPRVEQMLLPLRDGIMVIRKL